MCAASNPELCFTMTSTRMYEDYASCIYSIHQKVEDIQLQKYIEESVDMEFKVQDFMCVDWSSIPI
jgi:hypothetical protein